jgi:hypothetical protein
VFRSDDCQDPLIIECQVDAGTPVSLHDVDSGYYIEGTTGRGSTIWPRIINETF